MSRRTKRPRVDIKKILREGYVSDIHLLFKGVASGHPTLQDLERTIEGIRLDGNFYHESNPQEALSNYLLSLALVDEEDPAIIEMLAEKSDLNRPYDEGVFFLSKAIDLHRFDYVRILIARGADLFCKNEERLSPMMNLALASCVEKESAMREETKEIFAEILSKINPGISADEIEAQRKSLIAQTLVLLAYSMDGFSFPEKGKIVFLFSELLDKSLLNAEDLSEIEFILSAIQRNEFDVEESQFRILKSDLSGHASYFVVECENECPLNFYYVDGVGNGVEEEGFGVKMFFVDQEQYSTFEALKDEFSETVNFAGLKEVIKIAAAKSNAAEDSIFTKLQTRGNCEFKSATLLVRLLANLIYDKEEEEIKALHKTLKNNLIESAVNIIFTAANRPNSPFSADAKSFLQEVVMPNVDRKIATKEQGSESFSFASRIRAKLPSVSPKTHDDEKVTKLASEVQEKSKHQ